VTHRGALALEDLFSTLRFLVLRLSFTIFISGRANDYRVKSTGMPSGHWQANVDRRSELVPAISALLLAAISPLALLNAGLSEAALKALTPDGYKVEKTIARGTGNESTGEFLVALSDSIEGTIKSRPVMLLLVNAGKEVTVADRVIPHDSTSSEFWKGPPNYLDGVSRENLGGDDLILVRTVLSGGGSGSLHFFDFYRVERNKLRLVRSFSHGRMEQTYFAVYQHAVYDAEKVCARGEKHGNAYVYTCYLQVTKYGFDGQTFRPLGSERMREQRGNRFLGDKYWFISVLSALQKKEIFAQAQ
jgi:hypothetical protein